MATITLYLPKGTKLAVSVSDSVVSGQVLSHDAAGSEVTYDLVKLLSIKPAEVKKVLHGDIGQTLHKGAVLAKKAGVLSTKKVIMSFEGTITSIDTTSGIVKIMPKEAFVVNIVSPVDGKIKKITEDELDIEFNGTVVFAKQGIGDMLHGTLAVVSAENQHVMLETVTVDYKGCILVGGIFDRYVLEKAFGLGVKGIAATSIEEHDFAHFERKKDPTIGILVISKADYTTLSKFHGKMAVMEGMHKRMTIQN